jgi:cysteine desulfurase/selenocysteine lyase
MTLDWQAARAQTPGCNSVIHFNNAGTSLAPQPVLTAVLDYLQAEALQGGYELEAAQAARLADTYAAVAELIGARRTEIAMQDSASRAWAAAFYAIPFSPGDRILCSVQEYAANYIAFLQVAAKTGARVEVVPNDESGQLDLAALERMMDGRVKLIAVTHIPTSSGTINPAEAVGVIARQAGCLYLLDACQSVGQLEVNVERIGCDMLSATGRKYLRAPRGTAFLYVRESALDRLAPAQLDHHSGIWTAENEYNLAPGARRFEFYEGSMGLRIGLGVAARYALQWDLPAIEARVMGLAAGLREGLAAIPGVVVQDRGERLSGIVTFTVAGLSPVDLRAQLRSHSMNIWAPGITSGRLDLGGKGLEQVARASIHYYNTEAEVDRFCSAIEALA